MVLLDVVVTFFLFVSLNRADYVLFLCLCQVPCLQSFRVFLSNGLFAIPILVSILRPVCDLMFVSIYLHACIRTGCFRRR